MNYYVPFRSAMLQDPTSQVTWRQHRVLRTGKTRSKAREKSETSCRLNYSSRRPVLMQRHGMVGGYINRHMHVTSFGIKLYIKMNS